MKDPGPYYPSGVNLLSDRPVWVFVDGHFMFGMKEAPTQAEHDLIVAANPGKSVAYLCSNAPIRMKIPPGVMRNLTRGAHTEHTDHTDGES